MSYDEYIRYLTDVLKTGIENEKLDDDERTIFSSLASLFNAVKPADSDKDATKGHKENHQKITTAIESVFLACKASPLLQKAGDQISVAIDSIKNSGALPAEPPLIIAGPIVRRVEPESATVWVALSKNNKVTLEIFDDNAGTEGDLLFSAKDVSPVKFGVSLFIVAVTAKPEAGQKKLEYGKSYLYNLKTAAGDLKSLNPELAYPSYSLPAFTLPPLDVNKIHIIHSSCRNMGNEAYDTMPALDALMESEWKTNRPQQLFLSGDQVYADEGNEILEHLYINTGNQLMAGLPQNGRYPFVEKMRSKEGQPLDICPAEIIPGERGYMYLTKDYSLDGGSKTLYELIQIHAKQEINIKLRDYIHDDCGFTPTSRFHVFSLADFFGLYLLNWSELLWPEFYRNVLSNQWATNLSIANKNEEAENLMSKLGSAKEALKSISEAYLDKDRFDKANPETKKKLVRLAYELLKFHMVINNLLEMINAIIFASSLGKVRRALANISTYMIFDDHEITDDWHMTREWVHRAYSMPMGRRVLQNGLAAFAVFQAWGNTPDRFDKETTAGKKLLNALSKWITVDKYAAEATEDQIANLLKIPNKSQVQKFRDIGKNNENDFPSSIFNNPLTWHFQVNHPKYEVLVLDTRTERSFPGTLYEAAEHMSEKTMKDQLATPAVLPAPFADKLPELTFVISPCNIITIPMVRNFLGTALLPMAQYAKNYLLKYRQRWTMTAYDPDQADSWELGSGLFEKFLSRMAVRSFKEHPAAERKSNVVILSGDVHFSFACRLAYWSDKPLSTEENKAHEMVIAHLTASGMKNETAAWKTLKLDIIGYEFTDFGNGATRLPEPEVMVGYAKAPATMNKVKQDEIVLRTRWIPNYKPSMITRTPVLLPHHKIHPEVTIPKPEWLYRVDFIRGEKLKDKVNVNTNVNLISHLDIAKDQAPSTEIIRRSTFASITMDWDGEGKLSEALDQTKEDFTINVSQGKSFPRPPFYLIIDKEILFVMETEMAGLTQMKILKAKRGKAGTTAANHLANATAKTRRTITQTNWMTAEPKKSETNQPLKYIPITMFKVAMAADDPQFAKPKLNII